MNVTPIYFVGPADTGKWEAGLPQPGEAEARERAELLEGQGLCCVIAPSDKVGEALDQLAADFPSPPWWDFTEAKRLRGRPGEIPDRDLGLPEAQEGADV